MKVAVDARFVGTPGGLGRYVEELVAAMAAEPGGDEFVLFLREAGKGRFRESERLKTVPAEVRWYTLREQLRMPKVAKSAGADLVHWTHWNVPLSSPRPFVVTIHDLIMLDYPSVRATTLGPIAFAVKNAGFRVVLWNAVRNSAAILVPSGYVKKRVLETWNLPSEKVIVTGEGVSALPKGDERADQAVRDRIGLRRPYLLNVGNAYPHKNLDGLLRAFAKVRESKPETTLVLAGNDDRFFRRLKAESSRSGQDAGVKFLPAPSDTDLAALYRGAAAYVAPSFIEGFGLTPLEAMSAGIPTVASRGGSLPEVLGEAAEYMNPHKPEEMAEAILRVLSDSALRARLAAAGPLQAAKHSWKEAAARTLAAYRKALGK